MLLAGGLLLAADAPKEEVSKDLDKLQGTWVGSDGTMKLVIKGNKYTFTSAGDNEEGTLKADASKKPAALDIHISKGPQEGKTQLAVYQLEGDTLKICYAEPDKERPTELAAKDGSGQGMLVLKREKP
jgi:uncharacterized protein (TIGR03067 family)